MLQIPSMTLEQMFRAAETHHRAGRLAEADKACRAVLAHQPDHPEALHLLGIVTAQSGRLDAGAELIRRAVKLRPDFAQALGNLARVLVNQGKSEEAIAVYRRLVALRPTDATAHYGLGLLLRDAEKLDEAIAAFARAAELDPASADAHFKLGMTLRRAGRLDEAMAAYAKVIQLKPDSADAHNNLANVLRDKRMFAEAVEEYRKAIALKGDDAVAHLNLGNALCHSERFSEAAAAYARAVEIKPDFFDAHSQMGLALANLQRFDEALASHRRALALRPDDPSVHETMAATLLLKHDMFAAAESFRHAVELAPQSATSWNGLGMALQALGKFDEASDCFRRALAINPEKAFFHRNLATASRQEADPAQVEQLTRLLDAGDAPVQERVDAGFALGKLLDDSDRFDEAFASYEKANRLLRESRAAEGHRFDAGQLHRTVDRMMELFTPDFFARRSGWGHPSELPVFIVGMPRSGTTLVEQIAASHASVFGAGELQDIERLYATVAGRQDVTAGASWDAQTVGQIAQAYLAKLRSLGGDALRVTDKMPGNVFHLGLIATLFPQARVIFCRRDLRDTSLSCFFTKFGKRNDHVYTHDLGDCGRQCMETDRLVGHWLKALPLRMLEVQYETMVAEQEAQTRRLIDFLGLPWDPACLEFHRTERTVVTASAWQVRQPMYNRSVARWRNYQRHLGPLMEVLRVNMK